MKHPEIGPEWRDENGQPPRLVRCPACGQKEWWTEDECRDHGKCRLSPYPCWCEKSKKPSV